MFMASNEITTTGYMMLPIPFAARAGAPAVEAASPAGGAKSRQEEPSTPGDKVTLRDGVQKVNQQARKLVASRDAERRENAWRTPDSIRFSYNFRGDLRIVFMDSANKLVYQTPPVQFLRMTDLMKYHALSVDTQG
jgi:hypothetical protein